MFTLFISLFSLCLISCSDDDNSSNSEIQGTFQLTKFEDSSEGTVLSPDDNKPVKITFRADGSFDGMAGNNEIQGSYSLDSDIITFNLFSTEIAATEREVMFVRSINKSLNGGEYIMPYSLKDGELTLEYETQSKMSFIQI